ncbi:hypothetical protein [Pseudomonas extremaustralis]|nr:hypothetical protein [Pseudomonas extremaustralis]
MNNIPKGFKLVPVEPTAEMIEALAAKIYPDDNQAGKRLQRLRGTGVVFPKYEIESAVGKYERMLAAAPTPPQPIYDEAKERGLFEVFASTNYVVPPGVGHLFVRCEVGEGYRLSNINHAWHGWLACAQSRAKAGEDE